MPFGIKNGPAFMQTFMRSVLGHLEHDCATIYLDDILVYSPTKDQHEKDLIRVFQALQEKDCHVRIEKCELMRDMVNFVGFELSKGTVRQNESNTEAVLNYPTPTSRKGVQRFLGLANYYSQFLPKFSDHAKPLTALTKQTTPFAWTAGEILAFRNIKEGLAAKRCLAIIDPVRPVHLQTDASSVAWSAVISQQVTGSATLRPLSFVHGTFSETEQNWDTTDRELSAIVFACRKHPGMLRGRPVTILTDHKSLVTLHRKTISNDRQARWASDLMDYDLTVKHLPGIENVVADALSRPDGLSRDPIRKGPVIPAKFPEVIASPISTERMMAASTPADGPAITYARQITPRGAAKTRYVCRRRGCRQKISSPHTSCHIHEKDCAKWAGNTCEDYEWRTGESCGCGYNT
jgi:hypothetical protein